MEHQKEKKDFKFDKRAAVYDNQYEGKVCERFYQLITENLKLKDGDRVLDVGCGTGTVLKRLSDKNTIAGYGIDIEEKMLEQAKKKCPQMNIQQCNCNDTPFDLDQFDSIIACMTLHHFSDPTGFAKEAARILKPGGKLYIADPGFSWLIRKIVNRILSNHKIIGNFRTVSEMNELFRPYGFQITKVKKKMFAQLVVWEKE